MGGALERDGGAGEALLCAQGGSGALHAEDSTKRLSEADLPGVERAGGAEDK